MKIEMNTIYHLPTQAHEDDFLKQAEKQGVTWSPNFGNRTVSKPWRNGFNFIRVNNNFLAGYDKKLFYEDRFPELPIIEWKIEFSKADMQIGQIYKQVNGLVYQWREEELFYNNELRYVTPGGKNIQGLDIIEVYPMDIAPIWKREEPKYRVKTELTKEQAEKLGLEFCEEVKE